MAEVLIKLERADNPTDKNAWHRGHAVCVKPDGWQWGRAERLPKFCVIRITDMTPEQVEPYMATEESDLYLADGLTKNQIAIRKFFFDLDDVAIPLIVKNSIKNTGMVSVTKAQIVNFIKRTNG